MLRRRRDMDGQDDAKGGRYLKYRPGWTVFQIPSTPGCLRAVGSVLCGSDWKHLNPRLLLFLFEIDLERRLPHQSCAAAGGRGPAVVRWLTRSSYLLTSPAAEDTGGWSAIGRVRGSAASALASGEVCAGAASNGRAAWAGGDQKLLALELTRQAMPQSLNSSRHRRRAFPERVPAAAALLRGV